jgi:hypothetical protein
MCPQLCKPLNSRALRLIGRLLVNLSVLDSRPDQFNRPKVASSDCDA